MERPSGDPEDSWVLTAPVPNGYLVGKNLKIQQVITRLSETMREHDGLDTAMHSMMINNIFPSDGDDPSLIPPSALLRYYCQANVKQVPLIHPWTNYRLEKRLAPADKVIPYVVRLELRQEAEDLTDKIFSYRQASPHEVMSEDLFMDTARVILNQFYGAEKRDAVLQDVCSKIEDKGLRLPWKSQVYAEMMVACALLEEALEQGYIGEYFLMANGKPKNGATPELIACGTDDFDRVFLFFGNRNGQDKAYLQKLLAQLEQPVWGQDILVEPMVARAEVHNAIHTDERPPIDHTGFDQVYITPPPRGATNYSNATRFIEFVESPAEKTTD